MAQKKFLYLTAALFILTLGLFFLKVSLSPASTSSLQNDPAFQAAIEQFIGANSFAVGEKKLIALSLDRQKTQAELTEFLGRYDVSDFALYHDTDRKMTKAYPLDGMPTTLLINPDGYILYEFMGEADWQEDALYTFLVNQIQK